MCLSATLRLLLAVPAVSYLLTDSAGVRAAEETADWWKAQRDLSSMLMEQDSDIAELATEVGSAAPATAQEAMFKLSVLMRTGMNKEAVKALQELKRQWPEIDNYQVSSIYYDACDNLEAWDVAKATVEVFGDNISEMALENRILKHFLKSGWSVQKVDGWLAEMTKASGNFWVKERLRFNVKHGQGDRLVKELSDRVRENPRDIERAVALLEALIYARHTGKEPWNLSWMAESVEAKRATEAEKIASRLKTLKQWQTAAVFFRQAVETPLTDEEVRKLATMCAAFVPPERLRAMFAVQTREGLAECLLKLGKKDRAQVWMVEGADIRKKHNLGLNALFAGEVQAASGQRVIEGRIRKDEKKSEDDPEYWSKRAEYYRGRKEPAQEEEALLRGLGLARPQPEAERYARGSFDWRSRLLADYAGFLEHQERTHEAVSILRKEIEQAPATSQSAKSAARLLAFDFEKQVSADDAVLWNWLGNRPKWEHIEERLLWRMLERAKPDEMDKHFIRAEELARRGHPSRAGTLGWIMNHMHFPKRSIALLEYAVANADEKELRESSQFTLFGSYLDTGDWKRAEQVFPQAARRLTPKELPDWYSRIAVTAAKAGAKTDAMRIWRRVANLSPSHIDGLEDLAEAGLRDELKGFYREMQKKIPSSEVPVRAQTALEKR